jgi:short-subunit dehydrogenase
MKYNALLDKVVVITGASSGLGKLAVEEFLYHGAKVVLAARSEEAMKEHLEKLNIKEDRAIAVKTDVSQPEAVNALARKAVDQFGRIDVWINNAAVNLFSAVEQLEVDEIRRVIDVNLLGQIYGMKAAIDVFKEQQYGNLINVASILAKSSVPLQSVYVASMHGVEGFSSVLREELMVRPLKNVDVSVIFPSSMDTPFFIHARSKLGRTPKPMPPVYDPRKVVQAMIACAKDPQPEIVVGNGGKFMWLASRVAPTFLERLMGRTGISSQITEQLEPMEGQDNLFKPMPGTYQIRGGYGTTGDMMTNYIRKHPIQVSISVAIPLLFFFALLQRKRYA